MAYGTIKFDTIVYTNNGADETITVSGLASSISGNITSTGTISGGTIKGTYGSFTYLTGVTTSGTNANFQTITGATGIFTSNISGGTITGNTAGFTTVTGTTVTGTTANFVTLSGTTITGTTINATSGVFQYLQAANQTFAGNLTFSGNTFTLGTGTFSSGLIVSGTISGQTVTGTTGQFTSITGGTAGFTTVTGTTVTGTTANFVTLSGTTVTGSTGRFTSSLSISGNNVISAGDTGTVTSTMLLDGTILNVDINASAAIAGSKIVAATTSVVGAVQLSDSTSTTSSVLAATPTAVKAAYDLANGRAALSTAQTFTAAQRGTISALTDGATITPDFALANNYSVTLGGNRTLANPTNLTAGQSGAIWITQDGTGSRTLAYGSYWDFTGGTAPTLTTTASARDCLVYAVQSSTQITATLITNLS